MRTSSKKVNRNLAKQIGRLLYNVIADIHDPKEAELFLGVFLTKVELEALTKRLAIAYWLSKGRHYDNIKTNLAVSSTTVATMAGQIKKKKGLQLAIKKISADEWADQWADKIGHFMKLGHK